MDATSSSPDIPGALEKIQYFLRLNQETAVREIGLTVPQCAALAALAQQSGLTAAALARRCFVTPQTMTGIVANLVTAGLIVREADPENLRAIRLRMTEAGVARFGRARTRIEAITEDMLRDIDRAEREALADLLMQCAQTLAQRLPQRRARRRI